MVAKSVSELLAATEGNAPDILWEGLTQKGISFWPQITPKELMLLMHFAALKKKAAFDNRQEYAYYFWNRVMTKLENKEFPIGKEWSDEKNCSNE